MTAINVLEQNKPIVSPSTGENPALTSAFPTNSDHVVVTILVVDDEPTNRTLCRGVLKKMGYRVREAVNGLKALNEVEREPPDVILMDVMMPEMDGLECTRRLKSSPHSCNIPIIIISACTDATHMRAGLDAGADEYLGKPLQVAELEMRLRSMTRLYRNMKEIVRAKEAQAAARALELELVERRKIEDALRQAKEAAEAANSAKSDFLATMSHELRTPLNGIIGMTSLLLRTKLDEQQRRYTLIANHSGDTLLCLINDILDFSKIEAGKVELEVVEFDVSDAVTCTIATLEPKAKDKGLKLVSAIHPYTPPRVTGDPGRIQQILMNLTANAVKFTEKGQVTIRVTSEQETDSHVTFRFTVDDTGIGIPADRLHRLFQPFSQVDASTTRKYGGTGLGLVICQRLVELMGGQIGVSSEADLGSTFWFTVTFARASNRPATTFSSFKDIRQLHVLVIDDSETDQEILCSQLAESEISVQSAPNAQTALQMIRQATTQGRPFDLAIVDMQLPGLNGAQLAQAIKADSSARDIVLLLISSAEPGYSIEELRAIGFAAALTKPVTAMRLLEGIAGALACATRDTSDPNNAQANQPENSVKKLSARLLLAEDNEIGREVALATLSLAGLQCDVVADGQQAVQAFASQKYDLIFMDCQMPNMDGFEATQMIRKIESFLSFTGEGAKKTPIIALTANAIKGDRERCIDAGMDDYLAKPYQAHEFLRMIERYVPGAVQSASKSEPKEAQPKDQPQLVAQVDEKPTIPQTELCPPFDIPGLLQRWGDNKEFAEKLIRMFQGQAPALLTEIAKHIDSGDAEKTGQTAHGLKGAAAYVSAESVRSNAEKLEKMGRAADLSDAPEVIKSLQVELQRCLEFTDFPKA